MNAQAAAAIDLSNRYLHEDVVDRLSRLACFDVAVDCKLGAIWVTRRADSDASVTRPQLLDTEIVDAVITDHLWVDNQVKVLASAQRNVFSLGGDLEFFIKCIVQQDRDSLFAYATLAAAAIERNLSGHGACNLNTVALVRGEAQGGGFEAALSCHVLVAERGVHFGFPEPLFGMFPGMGGEKLLAARVGDAVASRIMRSSNRYPAEFLFEIGIVDFLVEPGTGSAFVSRLLSRAQATGSAEAERFASRKEQLRSITRSDLDESIARWTEQAFGLSERHIRTMNYILEMQARRQA